jgi:GPH family glycoside/pentoside/hexuronide:cation symporter
MSESNEKIPRWRKVAYGAGDIGFSMTSTIIAVLLAIFLTDVVGLRPGLAAVALFIGRTWDYINDPLIGHLSDRTRSRWGRRRPFLLFGCLPFAIAFACLWWKPPFLSGVGLAAYYAAAYLFYDTCATLAYMPYFALTPELTLDYDERTSLTSYRMAFSIVGGLIAFTVPLALVGSMRPENAERVFGMGFLFGLLSALPLLVVFFATREREEFQAQAQPRLGESLRAAVRNRPFLFGVGIFLLTWVTMDIVQTVLLFFLKYRMHLEAESDIILGAIFVSALLVLPLWERVSRHWDKRMAYPAGLGFPRGAGLGRAGGGRGGRGAHPSLGHHPGRGGVG